MSKKVRRVKLLNTSRLTAETDINIGEVFEARVRGVSDTGNGIVEHPKGRLFFVPGVWLEERVEVRVAALKKRFGSADLVRVVEASAMRVESPCPYHGTGDTHCGGCPWMSVSYSAQLAAKQDRVVQAMGKIQPDLEVEPILAAAEPLAYRIRAQLKSDGQKLGFVTRGQRTLVDVEQCAVLSAANQHTLAALRLQLPNRAWKPEGKRSWTTVDIDESTPPEKVSINKRLPFQQANGAQNAAMRAWLKARLALTQTDFPAVELFAGSGNLTEILAAGGYPSVVAAEVVPAAVAELTEKNLANVTVKLCDLFNEDTFSAFWRQHAQARTLLLDPPREGLQVTNGMFRKGNALRDVLYISCDLATLCRDLAQFIAQGFTLLTVQPLDMFPQTPHIEVMVHLRRVKG